MKTDKTINNDIASTLENSGNEVMVVGKGIGFHTKKGTEISERQIEEVSRLDNLGTMNRFKSLLENLLLKHLQASTEIINYAKSILNRKINQNIYITLTDHIDSAIERCRQKIMSTNPLFREVKTFYKEEYLVEEYAIILVGRRVRISLPVDEAVSIVLHIVNTEYNTEMGDTIDITNLIQTVFEIVKKGPKTELDGTSLNYERFIIHLRFLAQRIYSKGLLGIDDNQELYSMVVKMYPEGRVYNRKVVAHIYDTYRHKMSDEEVSYLIVHIKRVRVQQERGESIMFKPLEQTLRGSNVKKQILAPVSGRVVPMNEVNNPIFNQEALSEGVMVVPSEGRMATPISGEAVVIFEAEHAVSTRTEDSAELIIHIDLDTVDLRGEHFTVHVAQSDHVKVGGVLVEFDTEAIREVGYDVVMPIAICNTLDSPNTVCHTGMEVKTLDPVIDLQAACHRE